MRHQLGWGVVVQERIDAVAHGVLQREVLLNFGDRGWVVAHALEQPVEGGDQLWLSSGQLAIGVGIGGVNHGA